MATYLAQDVAADLRRRLPGVPHKKLHKLLYYAQGHHLAAFEQVLFSETISAWDMGPVVGQLWYTESQQKPEPVVAALNEAASNTVGYVVSRYGRLNGAELQRLTHSEPPWMMANDRRQASGARSEPIDPSVMLVYFQSQSDDEDTEQAPLDPEVISEWLKDVRPETDQPSSWDTADSLLARLS